MKISIKFLLLLLFFSITISLFNTSAVWSQNNNTFSGEYEKFESEVKEFFSRIRNQNTLDELGKFTEQWQLGTYEGEVAKKIIETSNLMAANRLRPDPDFINYFNSIRLFFKGEADLMLFNHWHEQLEPIITSSRSEFNILHETLITIFDLNAVYSTSAREWNVGSREFTIKFDEHVVIQFENIDLQCKTPKGDTIIIYNTNGYYRPFNNNWYGNKGKITWQRVGLDVDIVYAELDNYNIDMNRTQFNADSVNFYNKNIFGFALKGKVEDRAMMEYRGESGSYPQFTSYESGFEIDKLAENVIYTGGFSMNGNRILGTATEDVLARIDIYYDNKLTMSAYSEIFTISPLNIISRKTGINIYIGEEDSIYHPQMNFNYIINERRVYVTSTDEGVSNSPFFNTYHKLEMNLEGLEWIIDKPMIDFNQTNNPTSSASFSSYNFYRDHSYAHIQSILEYNPVDLFYRLSEQGRQREFHASHLANYMKIREEYTEPLLIRMANEGFIIYNISTKWFTIQDKVINYFRSNRGVSDYDMIRFSSTISARSNAILSLLTHNLTIEGVPRIILSDSNQTFVVPEDQKIIVKKNRDMEFGGFVRSGRVDFWGNNFEFNYHNFKINLNNLDSMKLSFPDRDPQTNRVRLREIQTVIQDVNGYLSIDHPNNKSGRRDIPNYPIFECTEESYAYYDYPQIFNGVYNREKFYFNIDPFTIDSLTNFTIEGMRMPGTFRSAEIFPEFRYDLTIQEDYSLGFIKSTPANGYPMYEGSGKGKMTMMLSNQGFFGTGSIEYLNSVTHSDKFFLFPDSTVGNSKSFDIPDNAASAFPYTKGRDVYTQWMPYKDSMYITDKEEPFTIYNELANFTGTLALTPSQLSGIGQYRFKNALLESKEFAFGRKAFDSDTTFFRILSNDPEKFAFESPNVKVYFDMEKELVNSKNNVDTALFRFPFNRYHTNLGEFDWDIKKDFINLKTLAHQSVNDAYFLSVHLQQDSLKFNSSKAHYDLKTFILNPQEIPYIAVADARIFPNGEEINIEEDAFIPTLFDAKIKLDTIDFVYELYEASIDIRGRKNYSGNAYFDYKDHANNVQQLYFNKIDVGRDGITNGVSEIADSIDFFLSPQFKFFGNITLRGNVKVLNFNGWVLPLHEFEQLATEWFRHNNLIYPDSLYFNIAGTTNQSRRPLLTGMYITSGASQYMYSRFLGSKVNYSDIEVLSVDTILYFDNKSNQFVICNAASLDNPGKQNKNFTIDLQQSTIEGMGVLNFGAEHEHVEILNYGKAIHNITDTTFEFKSFLAVNFPFHNDLLKLMADTILDIGFALAESENNSDLVINAVKEFVSNEQARRKIKENIESVGLIPDDRQFSKTMILTGLNFKWDDELQVFRTIGPIGLASSKGNYINKKLNGAIVFDNRRAGHVMHIYLEISPGSYHYFNYSRSILNVLSSNDGFNILLMENRRSIENNGLRLRRATPRQIAILKRDLELF